jgi:two-component system chemotaxis sensor kinase CheA
VDETREKWPEVDQALAHLATEPGDPESLGRLFRAMHTLKGTARFLGLAALGDLAAALEGILEPLQAEPRALPPPVLDLLGEGVDTGKKLLEIYTEGSVAEHVGPLLARLEMLGPEEDPAPPAPPKPPSPPKISKAPPEPSAPPPRRESAPSRESAADSTIRVDTARLDHLMNLVGEMVLGRNRLMQAVRTVENKRDLESALVSLTDTADFIDMITSDLQKAVIKTRMQPVGRIFNKFPRIVRDLAREKKKKVALEIAGADTELDKSVIDEISDPLVHLIRNAVDHGIEDPETRERAGKSPQGRILLAARQEGNRIAIEVADDGRGLDLQAIRDKAVRKGLIPEAEAETLPAAELQSLIFHPGFSTAETIDRTSGRGVGMDVVKSNIEKLGGYVELESTPGEGIRFIVKLPLTLAIIPVLMVRVCREIFALPAVSVIETVRLHPGEVKTIDGKEVVNLRGKILPILRISDLFHLDGESEEDTTRQYVVVTGLAERRIGLLIHGLIGQEEVVIKPLGDLFESTGGIAGATIRGDGRVALILDFSSLVKLTPSLREEGGRPAPTPKTERFPRREEAPETRPRRERLHILVVDDSATERKIVRKAIEALEHHVVEASDGGSALSKLGEQRFDLVITDIEMEGMDGLELAQRIRSQAKWKNLPVVALSTHGQMVDRIRGSEAGLDAYLVKPLNREDLKKTLDRFCQG